MNKQWVGDVGEKGPYCADEKGLPDVDDAAAGGYANQGAEDTVNRGQHLDFPGLHCKLVSV